MWEWGLAAEARRFRSRFATIAAALALACGAVGCGDGAAGGDGAVQQSGQAAITVTSRNYPEEEVLREIYAQSLEAAGFEVRRRELRRGTLAPEELEAGRVDGYPDHLETALTEATPLDVDDVPTSARAAGERLRRQFQGAGLVPFPPASFVRTTAIGIPREAAERQGIETLSDLKGPARGMGAIVRELYCHGRANCLGGLERDYGIVFETFAAISLLEPSALLYEALQTGRADAAVLITTEGELADGKKWLTLLEDEHRLPAANAFWMTSQEAVEEAGPAYEKAILAAQEGLTLQVMRELDAEVELEGRSPSKVAARYLRSKSR